MEPEQSTRKPGPCPKCGGTLVRTEDRYGLYLICLHCGKLIDPLASSHDGLAEERDSQPSPVARKRGRPAGHRTREREEMYRRWCTTILNEGLTVNQAADRFGVGYRTIYRILHRYKPESGQPEEPG